MEENNTYLVEDEEQAGVASNFALIALVRENSFLYDTKDERYKDPYLFESTWKIIGRELGTSTEEVRSRWQRLRNSYGKVLARRRKLGDGTGSSTSKRLKPWPYQEDMEFLRPFLTTNKSPTAPPSVIASGAGIPLKTESCATGQDQHDTSFLSKTVRKRKEKPTASDMEDAIARIIKRRAVKEEEDPCIGWFRTLLPMINSLSHVGMLDFQSKVVLTLKEILVNEKLQKQQRRQVVSVSVPSPTV